MLWPILTCAFNGLLFLMIVHYDCGTRTLPFVLFFQPTENFWTVCWSYAAAEQLEMEIECENLESVSSSSTDTEIVQQPPPLSPQQQISLRTLPPDQWSGHAKQLLIAAGFRGVIRVISLLEMRCIRVPSHKLFCHLFSSVCF